jgi:imidazoleglycerol-phosphate dehydratase
MRVAEKERRTAETDVSVRLDLDGTGASEVATGVGFLDHMLDQIARHGMLDLRVRAAGDRHIDDHHTVEDVGIVIGQALDAALGDKAGIRRYGTAYAPMDEALARAAVDLSGRPFLVWRVEFPTPKIGAFDTELVREFFTALAMNARLTCHVHLIEGANSHHIAESCFKALARSLREAAEPDPRREGRLASTKEAL